MWGNQKGWMISGGIVLATIALYAYLIFGSGISEPTALTTASDAMAEIVLPANPRALLPAAGGSSDGYKQAMEDYKADPSLYQQYLESGKLNSPDFKKLKAVEDLVSAAGSNGAIFGADPAVLVTYYPAQSEALKPIDQLGHVALRIGLQSNVAKKTDQAKRYLLAAYSLGYALANERLTYSEFSLGQDMMRDAALNMSTIDSANAEKWKAIDPGFKSMMEKLKFPPLLNPANDSVAATNAGDVFNLAQHSDERMWKIEAIMLLGHFRYNAAQPGDQRGANTVLAKMAADSSLEPAVAAAVKAAQELTQAGHRDSVSLPQ